MTPSERAHKRPVLQLKPWIIDWPELLGRMSMFKPPWCHLTSYLFSGSFEVIEVSKTRRTPGNEADSDGTGQSLKLLLEAHVRILGDGPSHTYQLVAKGKTVTVGVLIGGRFEAWNVHLWTVTSTVLPGGQNTGETPFDHERAIEKTREMAWMII